MKWHGFLFKISTSEGQAPEWWVDIFLADTIVRHLLSEHGADITIWRVHRRAANDDIGHKFTFFAYVEDEVAEVLRQAVTEHESLRLLRDTGLLKEYSNNEIGPNIDSTSDPNWPKEIKRAWPYFIQGVSHMILDLVAQLREQIDSSDDVSEIAQAKRVYSEVHQQLCTLWQLEGSHAFFHHINALFGYGPVLAKPAIHGFFGTF